MVYEVNLSSLAAHFSIEIKNQFDYNGVESAIDTVRMLYERNTLIARTIFSHEHSSMQSFFSFLFVDFGEFRFHTEAVPFKI